MNSEERLNWHFVPFERKGVALREMNSAQKQLASTLLAAGLSQQGVIKAHAVINLDAILKELGERAKNGARSGKILRHCFWRAVGNRRVGLSLRRALAWPPIHHRERQGCLQS